MAGPRSSEVLRHSVIDRLAGGGGRRGADIRIGVRELKAAVRRDVEWLLNSRRPLVEGLDDLPEARASILSYGIPDLTQYGHGLADRQRICAAIEEALRTFEPRLQPRSIKVESLPDGEETGPRLRFTIHGTLHVDPVREQIAFDTSVEMASGAVEIAPD